MQKILLLFLVLNLIVTVIPVQAKEKSIVWENTTINITLEASSKGQASFNLVGKLSEDLGKARITSIRASCGCTIVEYLKESVTHPGQLTVSGKILLNETENSKRVTVEITSEVIKSIDSTPAEEKYVIQLNVTRKHYIDLTRGVIVWKVGSKTAERIEIKNIDKSVISIDIQPSQLPLSIRQIGTISEGKIFYELSDNSKGLEHGKHYHVPLSVTLTSGETMMYGFHVLLR
jgi:hypothetical protein